MKRSVAEKWVVWLVIMTAACTSATGHVTSTRLETKPVEVTPARSPQPLPPVAHERESALPRSAEEVTRGDEIMVRADAAFSAGRQEEFRTLLEQAASLNDPRAFYNLGVSAQQQGALVTAEQHFRKALAYRPDYEAAQVELARMYSEGWGRPVDYAEASTRFEALANSMDTKARARAHFNLAVYALYGLGREHSLSAAREHLHVASELGLEEATALLSGIPADLERWPGAVPEADYGVIKVQVDARAGEYASRPAWAVAMTGQGKPRESLPLSGTFTAKQIVATGVPGSDRVLPTASSMEYTAAFEIAPGWIQLSTWHTNHQRCELSGSVISHDGDVYTLSSTAGPSQSAIDVVTGAVVTGECFVRVRASGDNLSFTEDWPRNCSATSCSARGSIVGRTYTLAKTDRKFAEVDSEEQARTADLLLTTAPLWTKADTTRTEKELAGYLGVWRAPHKMEEYVGDDKRGQPIYRNVRVTDELRICNEVGAGARFHLNNWTVNDHACDVEGMPAINGAGELILVAPSNTLSNENRLLSEVTCTLRTARERGRLVIREVWPEECSFDGCGARAHPTAASFPISRRAVGDCEKPYVSPFK